MLTVPHPGNKYFIQLGKLLSKQKPELAEELSQYLPASRQPIESDLTKVPFYFQSFCAIQQIDPKEYTGALYKSSKIDKRRFFIAVMILLYHPRTRLLAKCISETIGQDPGDTTRMIQQVEFRYQHIEEFRVQVDGMVEMLIKK